MNVEPILVHIVEDVGCTTGLEDLSNVGVVARVVARPLPGSVALVRPETVDGPRVVWASGGGIVPEAGEEEKAAGCVGLAWVCGAARAGETLVWPDAQRGCLERQLAATCQAGAGKQEEGSKLHDKGC